MADQTTRREGVVARVAPWGEYERPSGCTMLLAGEPAVIEMQWIGEGRKSEEQSLAMTFWQAGNRVSFTVREIFGGTMGCVEFVNHTWLEVQEENAKR